MFGEKAVRRNEAPISSATERVALLNTASSIGSNEFILLLYWPRSRWILYTSMIRLEYGSTFAWQSGGTTVVALYSCTIAGPVKEFPGTSKLRSSTGVSSH